MYKTKDKTIKFTITNTKRINVLDGCPSISGTKGSKPNKNTSKNNSCVRNIEPTASIRMPINPKINLKYKKEGKNYQSPIFEISIDMISRNTPIRNINIMRQNKISTTVLP